jgi:hypothetical protein
MKKAPFAAAAALVLVLAAHAPAEAFSIAGPSALVNPDGTSRLTDPDQRFENPGDNGFQNFSSQGSDGSGPSFHFGLSNQGAGQSSSPFSPCSGPACPGVIFPGR